VAGGLGFAALLGAVYGLRLMQVPPASGIIQVPDLASPARIVRDRFGVPHIEAETTEGAFVGLGLAHAQDRLWQMEMLRRSARGTLSELFGPTTLQADRLARTLGLAEAAEQELASLDEETRARIEAYASGVNAWIREVREGRVPTPLEFKWLDEQPAPWQPADTLAIVRLRAWMLGRSLGATLLLDRLVRDIGGVASEPFFPDRPKGPPPEKVVRLLLDLGKAADGWARASGMQGRVGSLGFVIGGEQTSSGYPLLANDPHVEFQLPPVFYVAHLRTEEFEVAGATWPGMPIFWTGTTRRVAWGQVALHANVSDLFEESLDPADPARYDFAGRWVRAESRDGRIRVRGADSVPIHVVTTRHGPLLSSVLPGDPAARGLALRWTGQHEKSGVTGLLALPHVQTWDEFREALRGAPAPPTVYLYGDRKGGIGVQVVGHLPLRTIETGLLPVPGRSRWYDWRGTIPFDELPHRTAEDGAWFVVGPRGEGLVFPVPISWLWSSTGAPERLRSRLADAENLDLDDALALQRETRNVAGVDEIRQLLSGSERWSAMARRVHRLLVRWDGDAGTQAAGPAVYHAFRTRLMRQILERHLPVEQIDALLELAEPVPGGALVRYLERSSHELDPVLVHTALEETWTWLQSRMSPNPAKWSWGRIHRLELRHSFLRFGTGATRVLGRTLSRGPFPAPGDPGSVWTMHSDGRDPFAPQVGPAFRLAVDLGDPLHAYYGLAGGQSGLPGSSFYADALGPWLRADPRVLWMHRADVAYHARGTWELRPDLP
jgi:penicillin amidase